MYPPPPASDQPPQWSPNQSGPRAGFWQRFVALFIDGIILGIVPLIIILSARSNGNGGLLALGYLVYFVGAIAYYVYFEGGPTGQTLGKRAMGIRVIDFNTGGSIGHGRAFIRLIGRYISGLVCYLGYLWMLWDKEKQCWHDKMANDVVVPVQYYPVS
jgi:uncharacterized RDD family membrane protein YckC